MTDPQLINNNNHTGNDNNNECSNRQLSHNVRGNSNSFNNVNNNNNNIESIEEPKYQHKKFKKMSASEVSLKFATNISSTISSNSFTPENKKLSSVLEISNNVETNELRKYNYICPHCKLSCSKPSVLEKHIRAHTNERPYPCALCGFAFKTKSNLYKHFKSRAHMLKKEDGDLMKISQSPNQLSDESDVSSLDSISNGADTPPLISFISPAPLVQAENPSSSSPNISPRSSGSPCSSPILNTSHSSSIKMVKVYKPKFHTTRKYCVDTDYKPKAEQLQKHIERIITENEIIIERLEPKFQKFSQRKLTAKPSEKPQMQYYTTDNIKGFICPECKTVQSSADNFETNGNFHCKKCESVKRQTELTSQKILTYDFMDDDNKYKQITKRQNIHDKEYCSRIAALQPMSSPGPLLGNTRLVDSHCQEITTKRPRLDSSVDSCVELTKFSSPKTLQMFGGEVRILDKSGESKTMRIEPRTNKQCSNNDLGSQNNSETTSVVVRSSLHSGGTMLHKYTNLTTSLPHVEQTCTNLSIANLIPNISPPSLAPSISYFEYLKPANVLHAGKLIPHVPGIPGPQTVSIDFESIKILSSSTDNNNSKIEDQCITTTSINYSSSATVSKFLRPSSLPLKPGTFTPKRHHGITPTANTLSLISPETPRPKKSYGQLYLNGHAYTYLGLKCSTRLFYCTLNRTQPMYVTQQHGLSMYSNWKICKEAPSYLEFVHYDSTHRLSGYTLASNKHTGILTHSSQRPNTPNNSDSGLEGDNQDKKNCIKLLRSRLENNKDYTFIHVKGRGRFVCNECGILCRKPSILNKHLKTHIDDESFDCQNCDFSIKSKNNLARRMKSKGHQKKYVESKNVPVLTNDSNENTGKKFLNRLTENSNMSNEVSSSNESEIEIESISETETECAKSEESESEERNAAHCLLSLAGSEKHKISGLLSLCRPSTYPYALNTHLSSTTKSKQKSNLFQLDTSDLRRTHYNLLSKTTESRLSVIHSCKKQDGSTIPIDLTIKPSDFYKNQSKSINTLTGTSGPVLIHSIIQTKEHVPRTTENDLEEERTKKEMFQAYFTERYLKDNKVKEQYRIFNNEQRLTKESDLLNSSNICSASVHNQENESITFKYLGKPNQKTDFDTSHLSNDLENNLEKKNPEITQNDAESKTGFVSSEIIHKNSFKVKQILDSSEQQNNKSESNLKLDLNDIVKLQLPTRKIIPDMQDFRTISLNNSICTEVKSKSEFIQSININPTPPSYMSITEDTRNVCSTCNKVFSKQSQLRLHINIHYFERPFRCESCGTSFRTKGHLTKHERSTLHHNKVNMTSTFGAATSTNPRPFKCVDCKSAFRIHGHLAKHLRSKMHIMKLECLRKLPFGTYAEMERSGVNLNDIDTTDCETSLISLQTIAQKLCKIDHSRLEQFEAGTVINDENSGGKISSDEEVNFSTLVPQNNEIPKTQKYNFSFCDKDAVSSTAIKVDSATNNLIYKCQMCSIFFQNSRELQMHHFVEHNNSKTCVSENYNQIKEKENTHKAKNDKITVTKIKEQNVDAT